LPGVGPASQDDVVVRVPGIPVIDGHPVEPRAEVAFGVGHQVAGKRLEVRQLGRILRQHDETKVVTVIFATFGEGAVIDILAVSAEHRGRFAVARHAVAATVLQMGDEGGFERCRTTRALTVASRERLVSHRCATRLAARPRPNVPVRRTGPDHGAMPPALSAAARAWAMKGRARWLPRERMRPGRTRKSSSRVTWISSRCTKRSGKRRIAG
jgi:hypothetical protein